MGKMYIVVAVLCLCWGLTDASDDWCYTGCDHSPSHWADLDGAFCGGDRQSPIDIVRSHVKTDEHLGNFTFVNFSSREVFHSIVFTGHTVKVNLEKNTVEVHDGGLNGTYVAAQFHFHWGQSEMHPGSEHLVDGTRFPMEMHVVTLKEGLNTTQALADPEGIAVLAFLIQRSTNITKSEPWVNLTSHLTDSKDAVNLTDAISISDLIGDVDLTKFYRYKGSLTTPSCNEVVVWTVFAEPVHVHADLLDLFPTQTSLTNAYRPTQPLNGRHIHASPAVHLPAAHPWCYHEHECDHSPAHWHTLAGSYCAGHRQSPININTKDAEEKDLDAFTFTHFDDKHAFESIINTGHTVRCDVKKGRVEVSGGGLEHVYSVLQLHLHWGDTDAHSTGSEHLLNSKRFPMEMHIVTKRKDLELNEAITIDDGLAVLGFFIEASDDTKSSGGAETPSTEEEEDSTSQSNTKAWTHLTSYFSHINTTGSMVTFTAEVSIDDLLGGVDRGSFFRYNGSLTTPKCNEAVVWTVFEHPVKVDHDLMKMFPTEMGYHDVFRPTQTLHDRVVFHRSASAAQTPTFLVLLLTTCAFLWH